MLRPLAAARNLTTQLDTDQPPKRDDPGPPQQGFANAPLVTMIFVNPAHGGPMGLGRDLKRTFRQPHTVDQDHPMRPRARRMRVAAFVTAIVLVLLGLGVPLAWWATGALLQG